MVRQSLFVKVQSDKSMIEHVTENETTEDLEVSTLIGQERHPLAQSATDR